MPNDKSVEISAIGKQLKVDNDTVHIHFNLHRTQLIALHAGDRNDGTPFDQVSLIDRFVLLW